MKAIEIANKLHHYLDIDPMIEIDVFNTSDKRFRFKEIKDILTFGVNFKEEYIKWKEELIKYLKLNLLSSDIYLLLITKKVYLKIVSG